jgi:hypothetical protein
MVTKKCIKLDVILFEFIKKVFSSKVKRVEVDKLSSVKQIAKLKYRINLVID